MTCPIGYYYPDLGPCLCGGRIHSELAPCDHGQVWPHWVSGVGWPALDCGGSPDAWWVYTSSRRLHRWNCKANPGALLGYYGGPLRLATEAELWEYPVGVCCREDRARRYAA